MLACRLLKAQFVLWLCAEDCVVSILLPRRSFQDRHGENQEYLLGFLMFS